MRRHLAAVCSVALVATALMAPAVAASAGEPSPSDPVVCAASVGDAAPELSRIDARARMRFIESRLVPDGGRARLYSWAWGVSYAGVGAYELVRSRDDELSAKGRIRAYVESGSAMLTPTIIVAMPLHAMEDASRVRSLARRAGRDLDPCDAVERAEQLLVRDARSEQLGVHWLNQVFSIGTNVALAAFLRTGHTPRQRQQSEALLFAGGMISSELQIVTQPTGAVDALDDYRSARLDEPDESEPAVALAPFVTPGGGGLLVGGTF